VVTPLPFVHRFTAFIGRDSLS